MSQSFPEDLALGYGLVALCQSVGARSGWLQKGRTLIDSNLPFAESRIEEMISIIDEMATSYASVGREMETVYFGYRENFLLCIFERSLRVALLFPADSHFKTTDVTAARRFLRKNRRKIDSSLEETLPVFLKARKEKVSPPPVVQKPQPTPIPNTPDPWPALAPRIRTVLTRVVHSAQAQNMIERTLASLDIKENPTPEQIPQLVRLIVRLIPHRGKQAALGAELEDILEEYGLTQP